MLSEPTQAAIAVLYDISAGDNSYRKIRQDIPLEAYSTLCSILPLSPRVRSFMMVFAFVGAFFATSALYAQSVGLKTNLLYDATTTLNAGVEIGLSKRWTLDISGNYNPWTFSGNRKLKHWLVQPELRYWFSHRFGGHFIGMHSGWADYNIGSIKIPGVALSNTSRYEGTATGAGFTYGYALKLAGHLNLEFAIGAGWIHTRYDRFRCARCGVREEKGVTADRFVPTKAAVSLVYVLGKQPEPLQRDKRVSDAIQENTLPGKTSAARRMSKKQAARYAEQQAKEQAELQAQAASRQQAELQARETRERALLAEQQRQAETQALRQEYEAALAFLCPASGKEIIVQFPSGKSDIDENYAGNDSILAKLITAITLLSRKDEATGHLTIKITGYASPDGKGLFNQQLSADRATALKTYLRNALPALPDSLFLLHAAGEDWEGVRQWVAERPDMKYRDEVLRIIDRVPIGKGRKKQLMDLKWGRPYTYLSEFCFPTLRNACCVVIRME